MFYSIYFTTIKKKLKSKKPPQNKKTTKTKKTKTQNTKNKKQTALFQFMLFYLNSITVSWKKPDSTLCILLIIFLSHIHKFICSQVTALPNFQLLYNKGCFFSVSSIISTLSFKTHHVWFLLTISFKASPVLPLPEPKASAIGFTLLLCKQPLLGTRPCSDHLLFGVNH